MLPAGAVRRAGVLALVLALVLPIGARMLGWAGTETDRASTTLGQAARPSLVHLPGGSFEMGSPEGVGDQNEHPRHRVELAPFSICETEVTNAQYALVMGESPSDCDHGCGDEQPVQNVSWEDAVRYLNALTRLENRAREAAGLDPLRECYNETTWAWAEGCNGYRLPTEAEWEYAARAGTTTAYSFGDDIDQICKYAEVRECDQDGETTTVKRKRPNQWGLYAMHGNVWEWVLDVWDAGFYENSPRSNPKNDKQNDNGNGVLRVIRGGSFDFSAGFARSADRFRSRAGLRFRLSGFRCALGPRPSIGF